MIVLLHRVPRDQSSFRLPALPRVTFVPNVAHVMDEPFQIQLPNPQREGERSEEGHSSSL